MVLGVGFLVECFPGLSSAFTVEVRVLRLRGVVLLACSCALAVRGLCARAFGYSPAVGSKPLHHFLLLVYHYCY